MGCRKKIGQLVIIIMFSVNCLVAQNYHWAKSMGSSGNTNSDDWATSIATDGSGNVFVTGIFQKVADFDPGPGTANLTPFNHNFDIFFAKYDANGNYLWAKNIGGVYSDYGWAITTDNSGNVLITGYFLDTVDFDPGAGTANLTSKGASRNIFFAKYDDNGNYLWAKSINANIDGVGKAITMDGSGNVILTGSFTDTADFDPGAGTVNLISNGSRDIFFAKYDVNGNYLWAKSIGGSGYDGAESIIVDASGNILITGSFRDTVDFDPGAGTVNLISDSIDMYFAKYDLNGNLVWVKNVNNAGGYSITLDGSGYILLTGYCSDTADFDPGAGTANLISKGANDVFIAKYDTGGNYIWARNMGGSGADVAFSIATNSSNDVVITGYFMDTTDFDPGAGTMNLYGNGSVDVFVAGYDSNGNYLWAISIGSSKIDDGWGIAIDGSDDVLVAGRLGATADFDPGPGVANLTSNGRVDIFFAKYSMSPLVGIIENNIDSEISVYPNPTNNKVYIKLNDTPAELSVTLVNLLGQEILKSSFKNTQIIDLAIGQLKSGLYFIRIDADDKTTLFKIIKE
ncbi:MAG: T9SS type A sorting domain-containing protein [Bacteroidetes bacterium]|nr:T9SS type A sorting domain-containing protein [Bacteroidota bacterium]